MVTLSQASEGMLLYKKAAGKSQHTIRDYRCQLDKLKKFLPDDPPLESITCEQLVEFFVWLRDDYVSNCSGPIPRAPRRLSPKSIFNIHIALSALWSWAVEMGLVEENVVRSIKIEKPQDPVIETFGKEQVEAILRACERSLPWGTRPTTTTKRPTADRDRAIVLLLLDTGLRASELCNIKFGDVDLSNGCVKVTGKGDKERVVYFGKRTTRAIWKYIVPRLTGDDEEHADEYLFAVGEQEGNPRKMRRRILTNMLQRLGDRAGVPNTYTHRFRHTFAINYLRNDGDLLTLQALLGHSDLTMVRRYARIAQMDCKRVHKKAGPVDNWKL